MNSNNPYGQYFSKRLEMQINGPIAQQSSGSAVNLTTTSDQDNWVLQGSRIIKKKNTLEARPTGSHSKAEIPRKNQSQMDR